MRCFSVFEPLRVSLFIFVGKVLTDSVDQFEGLTDEAVLEFHVVVETFGEDASFSVAPEESQDVHMEEGKVTSQS